MSDATWNISVKGQVQKPGSYRTSAGDNLLDIIFREAGGVSNSRFLLKAVLTGGSLGYFADNEYLKTPIQSSQEIMVFDEGSCMVNVARLLVAYNFACLPDYKGCDTCRAGLKEAENILGRLCSDKGSGADFERLQAVAAKKDASCPDGCSALRPLCSALALYFEEFASHAAGYCPASICGELMLSPCANSCPANVDLPGTIALTQMGKFQDALALGRHDNPFFLTCGFVCEEPPCQKNCKRLTFDEAVYSQSLHRYTGEQAAAKAGGLEKALNHADIRAGKETGKKIAIAGAGPAGLTAAYFLARLGHKAVIYEKAPVAGGMIALGIPAYRADRKVLAAEIKAVEFLGVEIKTNCEIGKDIAMDDLCRDYDAVLVAVGACLSRKLGIPGEDLPGVVGALDFLADVALQKTVKIGEKVLVVGGGNVAIDAARSVRRLGAREVEMMCVEDRFEMPATRNEIHAAEQEGITIATMAVPLSFEGEGRVEKVKFSPVQPGPYDEIGRRWPPQPLHEQIREKSFDMVIIAIGQMPDTANLGDSVRRRGPFLAVENYAAGAPGVFAAGDCAAPVNTVVKAVKAGKEAAFAIDRQLTGISREMPSELRRKLGCYSGACIESVANRVSMPEQEPSLRINNFDLVELGLNGEQAGYEMLRCVCAAKGAL